MQRCPYLHEMKERLLSSQGGNGADPMLLEAMDREILEIHQGNDPTGVGTIVKLNSDGYGSHTSPAHHHSCLPTSHDELHYRPKNAKTSLFIIMSFIYAKLLVVICIAYVVSEVVTHNLPVVYYEGFFTYLYGVSILFLLYVFCFLLQESTCCQGGEPKPKKPKKQKEKVDKKKEEKEKAKEKEKENKKNKKKEKETKKEAAKTETAGETPPNPPSQGNKNKNIFQNDGYPRKMKDLMRMQSSTEDDTSPPAGMGTLKKNKGADSPTQEKLSAQAAAESIDQIEAGPTPSTPRKRKTSQNSHSHGSFFLRVGAIAFGLATMIYNGLEFGAFFEIPFSSPCYQVLRGVNPVLQMVFTFMQMYFIFMNSRLNIHRFKVIARFGLMHIVATNLCVWIRTLVLESLKEITGYLQKNNSTLQRIFPTSSVVQNLNHEFSILESIRDRAVADSGAGAGNSRPLPELATPLSTRTPLTTLAQLVQTTARSAAVTTKRLVNDVITTTTTAATPSTTPYHTTPPSTALPTTVPTTTTTTTTTTTSTTPKYLFEQLADYSSKWSTSKPQVFWDDITGDSPLAPVASALVSSNGTNIDPETCGRVNIMGNIVQDSAPYLFPFIIEYSLIGAAVIYVMWRHIGRNPRYHGEEDLEQRLEVILSRRAVAMAHAHNGRMDCVGASKGLFFGLLLLVGSLICLILFFVLIHHPQLGLLAIYLADVSHCTLMGLSIIAIIIGFIRVQNLKFRAEEQSDLNDILLRVSAFGLFVYAVFSIIAGSLTAMTSEPNLLVMITGILSVLQVVLQLLFIADIARRRVHLPEHDRSKPGRQVVTFLLICNVTMWIIYTFETQKVIANPVQLDFYGFLAWAMVQRVTLPLCIFHRFHSAVTLAEIWKTSYKPRLD
ncbi:proton channel OtopLc isoform X2 [Nilaparvata lugens]|nr:proton channel OtopLc isoform X2 [Nilaparvata lugens]XP_039279335.1 proton channel OtopLc isoform X2 [Nilaparvata lugens]